MTPRREVDLLGEREIPADALWGIHTLRAMENFRLAGRPVRPEWVRALAQVKQACASVNAELGYLPDDVAAALMESCAEVAGGGLADQFPVDAWQGGAGTSLNMNMNEVLANRTLLRLGRTSGDAAAVHPIETVNLHQSTNDVVPTAARVAAILELRSLGDAMARTQGAFQRREQEFAGIVKIGRTELQDAVPMTLGAEFSAWAEAFGRDRWRIHKCEERLRRVNLGGTAVGTGLTAPRRYIFLVIERLREMTGIGLARAENLVDATSNADLWTEVSGILDACACSMSKTARDLRLLHLLGEIRLAPAQAGSSIMPGKVNPVLLEAVLQGTLRARSNHASLADAAGQGTLQLNEFLPYIVDLLLETIRTLRGCADLLIRTAGELQANARVCETRVRGSVALLTALVPSIGYQEAQRLAVEFDASGRADPAGFLEERLGGEVVRRALDPAAVMALGHEDGAAGRAAGGADA